MDDAQTLRSPFPASTSYVYRMFEDVERKGDPYAVRWPGWWLANARPRPRWLLKACENGTITADELGRNCTVQTRYGKAPVEVGDWIGTDGAGNLDVVRQ